MKDYSSQNKKAWEYNAYDFWIQADGSPIERAKKALANPKGMLKNTPTILILMRGSE